MAAFELNEKTDFTPSSLRDYLNERYDGKRNGKLFNNQDIQQYTMRGRLPAEYGGCVIEVIENTNLNVKILRIPDILKK